MAMSDDELKSAYQQEQRKHCVPGHIKHSIMSHNRRVNKNKVSRGLRSVFSQQWVSFSAAAFSLVVLYGVYQLSTPQTQGLTTAPINIAVEYHTLEHEITSRNSYAKRFNAYTTEYVRANQLSERVLTKPVTLIANEGEWQFVDCQQHTIILSAALVSALSMQESIRGDIALGAQVAMSMNENGKILLIEPSTKPLMC
jgi:hypothetical protein